MTSIKRGSYPEILHNLLRWRFNVEIIHPQALGLFAFLNQLISKKPIVHIHWIEHKYTFGLPRTRFLSLIMFIGIILYLETLLFLSKILKCKLVVTLHNLLPHKPLLLPIERAVFKITLDLSNIIYVHSHYLKKMAVVTYSIDKRKIIVIPHGKWLVNTKVNLNQKRARESLGIPIEAFVISFVGRLSEDKGIHILLEALELMEPINDLYIIIAGKPASKKILEYIKTMINKLSRKFRIKFYPWHVSDKMLVTILKASNIGVIPYVHTYTPSTLILFLSYGIPVIIPDFPVVREFLGEIASDYDLFCEPNPISLKNKIVNAMQNREKLQDYKRKFCERASKEFDWQKCVELTYKGYLMLYRTN